MESNSKEKRPSEYEAEYGALRSMSLKELMDKALSLKLQNRGLRMGLCTITNAKSGACSEDCAFCAQSAKNRAGAPVYDLKDIDCILKEAEEARKSGAKRFSLVTSGKGPSPSLVEKIAEYVFQLKRRVDLSVCASLGIIDRQLLTILKEAGLARYHHNLEASKAFFKKICTSHSYDERLKTIQDAKAVGLEVCSGGIIGLGENEFDRYLMAKELSKLEVDSCPINILVPIKGTPLEDLSPLSVSEVLRAIAIFRFMLPRAAIRIAGGREKILKDAQVLGFLAGADAMLIGGYLTTRGRSPEEDLEMTAQIKEIWKTLQVY